MNKAQREAIRQAVMEGEKPEVIANMLKTPDQWGRLYDRLVEELQDLREKGVRVGATPSESDFKKQWARGYKSGDIAFRKNPMRQILESQKIVSAAQAQAWTEGFTKEGVNKFLAKQTELRDAYAKWMAKKENEGKVYDQATGLLLTKDQEKALKKLAQLGPRSVRTTAFKEAYETVKDVMKGYYDTISQDQRKENKKGRSGSWFYEIWYLE